MHLGTYFKYLNYFVVLGFTSLACIVKTSAAPHQTEQASMPAKKTKAQNTEQAPLINMKGMEVGIGNSKAPLTIVMYYSLTCPHCHDYQVDEIPKIKAEFIDKGLVYFIYRDFPTDANAVKAAKIAWCHGTQQYLAFARKLLETQDKWVPIDVAKLKEADKNLVKIAKDLGISEVDYKKCLSNETIEASILRSSFEAQKTYSINAAPAFLVNNEYYDGIVTADYIREKLHKMMDSKFHLPIPEN